VLFLEHKALYRAAAARSPEPGEDWLLPFGRARRVREGSDVSVIAYGMMVHKAAAAARQLEKEGISVDLLDLRTIVPLDRDAVLESVRRTGRALVVYEDNGFAGFGAEICAQIADLAFEALDAPVRRVSGAFTPIPFADPLERAVLPDESDIAAAIRDLASF